MARTTINLMIGGEAGQGLATVSQGLSKALVRGGWRLVMTQSYHSRIRGGHNTMAIRMSSEDVFAPAEEIDILVALNQETLDLHLEDMAEKGLVITGDDLDADYAGKLPVPFGNLAPGRFSNVAALGVVGALLGLEESLVQGVIKSMFGKKGEEVAQKNAEALTKAFEWAAKQDTGCEPLAAPADAKGRMLMAGNEAIALGAISAGTKFLSFYPMTPGTSIALNFIAQSHAMGLVAEQAEDEISAINMAVGASYAGAPSLVPTSGGGFALMCEGVSLSAMMETPVVVAVVQRPGPATGLPTRTEQGDLEMVLHAGHGEFARAVFAPGDIEECFHLSRRAVEMSERFQSPVFILNDQFQADSYRAVDVFDLDSLEKIAAPDVVWEPDAENYERYAVTEDGVSPRALPGLGKALVVADSDEHTPDGHITEDLSVRNVMNEKRLRKLTGLREQAVPPSFYGDEQPEVLLVCWGSAKGAVREAAQMLTAQGRKTGVCHFGQVWPLDETRFMPRFEAAGMVVFCEMNATGQFAKLVRRETGFMCSRLVLRYDGLPFTPQYILRQLAK